MAARTASVTVKLLDQVSSPARIVGNSLRALRGDMSAMAGAKIGIAHQIATASARVRELRSSLIGLGATSLVAAFGIKRLVRSGVELETVMMDIRQIGNLTAEATKKMADQIIRTAPTVNKSAGEMAEGVKDLMAAGLDPDRAMSMMPSIGKAATAYRAQVDDLAKAGFSVMDNLKVRTEDFSRALDIMATAGNAGSFELKDMAAEFPAITAAAQALGMKGTTAVARLSAALQIARKGASSGSEAATNVANLMQKIISPETTKKFKKVGIDIRKELKKVQKEGGDPFLMIAEQLQKATKGDLSLIGDFFQDAEVQKFLRPLIQNLDEYKKIFGDANTANGTVDKDYKNRMETFQSRLERLMNSLDTLGIKITEALMPYLGAIADKLAPMANYLGEVVGKYPEYVAAIVGATAALLGLAALSGIIRLFAAGLALFSFKGLRGLLNYLAPKGGGPVPPEATPAVGKPGAAAPGSGTTGAAAGGKVGTVTKPGPMTPSQLTAAKQGVANMNASATALGRFTSGLKGGVVNGLVYYFGTKAIDAGFDALPKPEYRAGYDPQAEMNMGIVDRVKRLWNGYPESEKSTAKPLAPADLGHSRRAERQAQSRYDGPNAEYWRSMMAPETSGKAAGVEAGTELGQGIKDGLAGKRAEIMAEIGSILSAVQAQLASAGLSLNITPKVQGLGPTLRGIHADSGVY